MEAAHPLVRGEAAFMLFSDISLSRRSWRSRESLTPTAIPFIAVTLAATFTGIVDLPFLRIPFLDMAAITLSVWRSAAVLPESFLVLRPDSHPPAANALYALAGVLAGVPLNRPGQNQGHQGRIGGCGCA